MRLLSVVLLSLITTVLHAQDTPRTAKELHALVTKAKTEAEYKTLATYYRLQGDTFAMLAKERKKEWDSELSHPTGGTKYPTGADRARQLAQSYQAKADEAFNTSRQYEKRAKDAEALVEKH